jgi:hypothetical protein
MTKLDWEFATEQLFHPVPENRTRGFVKRQDSINGAAASCEEVDAFGPKNQTGGTV